MHCRACDCFLTDKEASKRSATTGEYLDLCDDCLSECVSDELVIENPNASEHKPNGRRSPKW